ncbi:MAG: C-GCAxxG-C-C family protein [Clostridiales bacterium]|jgi:C_GCAxxG_C_C family probable redox protein|nr:C-GCAxxG-C-C family protein [Clostridiales bacterium]
MRKLAAQFYRRGLNCSQSILKAAELVYKIKVPEQSFNMCQGVGSGFGLGNLCCALVGGVMVFGLMFDENVTKRMRIRLFDLFQQKYGSIQCAFLTRRVGNDCEQVVADVAGMTQRIIEDYRCRAR